MANEMQKEARVFLFYGEEGMLIRQMADQVIEHVLPPEEREFNLTVLESDPAAAELAHMVESAPFFGDRKVVVVRNSKLFQAARRKGQSEEETEEGEATDAEGESGSASHDATEARLLDLIARLPSFTTLVFTATKADKRRKIVKLIADKGQVAELSPFRPLDERGVREWIAERLRELGKRIDADALEHLLAVVATMSQIPRGFLTSEIEKAALYSGDEPVISKRALEEVMASVPEVSAFAMTDALARRNAVRALARLEELFVSKEPPLKIIGLLAYNVRRWWQVRQVMARRGSEAEMASALGARSGSPGMVGRVIAQSRSFRSEALKQALLTLASANVAARSGGDPRPYIERVVIELCR